MTRYVVDASVAVKWFLPEEHADEAWRLVDQRHDRIAPDLIFVELANTFAVRHHRGELTGRQARDNSAFVKAFISSTETDPLVGAALELSLRSRGSVYDCLYAALAVGESCQLVTADRRFYNVLNRLLPRTMLWIGHV